MPIIAENGATKKILTHLEEREEKLLKRAMEAKKIDAKKLDEVVDKNWRHDNKFNHIDLQEKKTTTLTVTIDLLPEKE